MTAVRVADSLRYGSRLALYLLGVLIVGGGMLGLGLALGLDHARALLDAGAYSRTELAGGAVLTVLGAVALLVGLIGLFHKLVADSVAAGVVDIPATSTRSESSENHASDGDDTAAETDEPGPIGPSPGEQAARRHGPERTVPAGADRPDERSPSNAPTAKRDGEPKDTEPNSSESVSSTLADAVGGEGGRDAESPRESEPESELESESEPASNSAGSEHGTGGGPDPEKGTKTVPVSGWDEQADGADQPDADEAERATTSDEPSSKPTPDDQARTAEDDSPPEPSPEEIAFGSGGMEENAGEAEEEEEREETTADRSASKSVDRSGDSFGNDPLGGPSDE